MKAIFSPLVIGVLIAAAINQGIYFLAGGVFGEGFTIDPDGAGGGAAQAIPTFAPAVFTVFQGIVGGVIVAAIALATKSPRSSWWCLTLIGLALSITPTALATAGVFSTFFWLSLMHLVAGAAIIPLVARVLPEEKTLEPETTE